LLLGHFALGGEVGLYRKLGDRHLVQFGGLGRAGFQMGPARTSLLVGAGIVQNQISRAGGSVGVEVEVSPWKSGLPLALDVRYLTQFEGSTFTPQQSFVTVNLGSRLRF
jgi:hypothetical protein